MNQWTRIPDIRNRLEKRWNRGVFLSMGVSSEPFSLLRIPLTHPTPSELSDQFEAVREWISHWNAPSREKDRNTFTLEWRETVHRSLGRNKIPVAVCFSRLEDIISFLGKKKETDRFSQRFLQITAAFPELKSLLIERPMEVLFHDGVWPEILAILLFLKKNPNPKIYIRQMDIQGVDTKFVEQHKQWLGRLLARILPDQGADIQEAVVSGAMTFEKRFGFLSKPVRIRFRILDPDCYLKGLSDIEIPIEDFTRLEMDVETIFIVENEVNGLAFPPFPRSMVIFGLGYGLNALSGVSWLSEKTIWYWGDIDTHGFAMLDQIRHYFKGTRSFLMDEETLLSHRSLWGREPAPAVRELTRLSPEEAHVYQGLVTHRYAENLRLEQERIHFLRVKNSLMGHSIFPEVRSSEITKKIKPPELKS